MKQTIVIGTQRIIFSVPASLVKFRNYPPCMWNDSATKYQKTFQCKANLSISHEQ